MASLILRQSRQRTRRQARPTRVGGHPLMYLADDTGLKITLPYAPRTVELDGVVPDWQTLNRPGRLPLVLREGPQLHSLTFDAFLIGDPLDHQASAEAVLFRLRQMAQRGGRITLGNLGPSAQISTGWRLTAYRQRSELLAHGTNHATRAVVALSFLEASDLILGVGPVTGGAKPPAAAAKPKASGAPAGRTHTVTAGQTLWALAVRYYGSGDAWRRLADVNGIRDPRKLKVGAVLKVPA